MGIGTGVGYIPAVKGRMEAEPWNSLVFGSLWLVEQKGLGEIIGFVRVIDLAGLQCVPARERGRSEHDEFGYARPRWFLGGQSRLVF